MVINDAGFFVSHRLPLALGIRAAGFDVHIAAPRDAFAPRIEGAGLPLHAIPFTRRGTSPTSELAAVAALVVLYRQLSPDVVHHVSAKPILYGGAAARLTRVPAVVHAVSGLGYVFISETLRARALRRAVRLAYRRVTAHPNCAVILQNDDDRRTLGKALGGAQIVIIPGSGVDRSLFRSTPLPTGTPLVVLPSRMLWDKGIREFVEAARLLRSQGVTARFALVGGIDEGNPAAIPRETLEGWLDEGVIEWWGHRADMPAVFAESTVVCLPSYREGMPKALLEACVVGRPIVTTDVPGCRHVVNGGGHGVLVPPRDGRALAAALEHLLGDRIRLEKMAAAAGAVGPRFAVEDVIARTLAVYEALLRRV